MSETPTNSAPDGKEPEEKSQSGLYPWLLLCLLSLTYLLSSLDRIVINLLVEPIKADFGLTDTQISILQGPAFIAVFAIAIIPMGIFVDRMNRTRLLAIGLGFWSIATGLCGVAGSFVSLAFARAGVGLGESTLNPSGYSLISDAFDKKRLGLALGIFIMGGAVGAGLAFILGGVVIGEVSRHGDVTLPFLGVLRPWQLTFVILAVPGIILAAVLSFLPNPARKKSPEAASDRPGEGMLKAFYRRNKGLLTLHHLAMGTSNMVQLGMISWIAALLGRVYGWESSDIGLVVGLMMLVALPAGLIGGGYVGDFLTRFGAHMRLLLCALSLLAGIAGAIFYPVMADPWLMIALFGVTTFLAAIPPGVGNAALHHVVPGEIRGRVSSIYYLVVLVIGMAGPTVVALVSDYIFPSETGLRYALQTVIPLVMLVSALLFLACIAPYRALAERLDARDQALQ